MAVGDDQDQARERDLTWALEHLAVAGRQVTGPVEWPHVQVWSVVARIPTSEGPVWLKSVPDDLRHEAALTALVADRRPDAVPRLLAHDAERGLLLLADAGRRLREVIAHERRLDRWHDALALYAGVQRDVADDVATMLGAGVPDLRGDALLARYVDLVDGLDLGADARAAIPEVGGLVQELTDSGVPDSVQHDDLHDAQVFLGEDDTFTLTDWGDSCVAHPFLSLAVTLDGVIAWGLDDQEGSAEVDPFQLSYLGVWAEALGRRLEDLEGYARTARVLGWACRVVNGHVPDDDGSTRARLGMLLRGLRRV